MKNLKKLVAGMLLSTIMLGFGLPLSASAFTDESSDQGPQTSYKSNYSIDDNNREENVDAISFDTLFSLAKCVEYMNNEFGPQEVNKAFNVLKIPQNQMILQNIITDQLNENTDEIELYGDCNHEILELVLSILRYEKITSPIVIRKIVWLIVNFPTSLRDDIGRRLSVADLLSCTFWYQEANVDKLVRTYDSIIKMDIHNQPLPNDDDSCDDPQFIKDGGTVITAFLNEYNFREFNNLKMISNILTGIAGKDMAASSVSKLPEQLGTTKVYLKNFVIPKPPLDMASSIFFVTRKIHLGLRNVVQRYFNVNVRYAPKDTTAGFYGEQQQIESKEQVNDDCVAVEDTTAGFYGEQQQIESKEQVNDDCVAVEDTTAGFYGEQQQIESKEQVNNDCVAVKDTTADFYGEQQQIESRKQNNKNVCVHKSKKQNVNNTNLKKVVQINEEYPINNPKKCCRRIKEDIEKGNITLKDSKVYRGNQVFPIQKYIRRHLINEECLSALFKQSGKEILKNVMFATFSKYYDLDPQTLINSGCINASELLEVINECRIQADWSQGIDKVAWGNDDTCYRNWKKYGKELCISNKTQYTQKAWSLLDSIDNWCCYCVEFVDGNYYLLVMDKDMNKGIYYLDGEKFGKIVTFLKADDISNFINKNGKDIYNHQWTVLKPDVLKDLLHTSGKLQATLRSKQESKKADKSIKKASKAKKFQSSKTIDADLEGSLSQDSQHEDNNPDKDLLKALLENEDYVKDYLIGNGILL